MVKDFRKMNTDNHISLLLLNVNENS